MNILVTGGAGYIGSHAVKRLLEDGHRVVVMDNLFRGHRAAVPAAASASGADVPLIELDLLDTGAIDDALRQHQIEAVMNFAAYTYVGESVERPLDYYHNNTAGVLSLLRAMASAGVKTIVHSSTAATYGEPEQMPIVETTPQAPINPYGMSKLMVEHILRDHAAADPGFAFAILRYFNVAGSAADTTIGEDHDPETHLIPVLLQAALGKREKAYIFGDDYPTPDGTCIRDYIHVVDLAAAHVDALRYLEGGSGSTALNCGYGHGYSVLEIIEAVRAVTGVDMTVRKGERRPGDPAELVATNDKIIRELGWQPRHDDIDYIVKTALAWDRKRDAMVSGQSAAE